MTRDIADPIALTPNTRTNRDPRVQLNTHLKIAFEHRFRDGKGSRRGRVTLEARHHSLVVAFGWFGSFGGSGVRSAVDGFVEDGIFGVVFFHGGEVVGAFKEVLALAGGVFRTDRLTVDALRRQAL